ncbi:putative pentatricopeptide repeat-containing protein, chloroplastic-like [Capsicum annuum]|nr:putative pentatricopeptide repeat-containing protein, chloroplastic-like [Capsicum annuum]
MDYLSNIFSKKIIPLGSLVQQSIDQDDHEEIKQWLDLKEKSSTIFVSFGSEYFLSKEEIHEVPKGLELSKVNFIWVIRFPQGEKISMQDALPKGYLEKVGERGMVMEGWAPQAKILQHPSIGGFAVEYIGAAVEAAGDKDGNLQSEEIAKAIRKVVPEESGEAVRKKVKKLSEMMNAKGDEEIMDGVAQELLVALCDFMGEWVNTPRGWKWRSFTKVTLPIAVHRNNSYDELVASVKQSEDLDCASSNVVISYLMNSTEKVNPTIINNDARVSLYMMDVDANGFRPVLRINVVDRSFEGPMNSSPSPPWCPTVDDNLNDYESDGDHPMNMKDDCVYTEDVSLDSQDAEEDCGTGSQPVHSFFDGTNFYRDQIFAYKKQLKMLLDGAALRQSFDYRMEKSCTKLLKAKCVSPGCGWLLRARKYEISDRFHIYKYVGEHTCDVEHVTRKHKKMSSELIASLCINHFRDGKGPSISEIQRIVFKELHCHAIYWMCWKRSVITKNIIRGTPEHEYACLQVFSHMVELLNSGYSYSIMDTKNHIFPIAFFVIDKENNASCTFFFQKLKSNVDDEPDLCVIFDGYISIANAFSRVYSRAHYGLCMRHLAENLFVNQHCGEHLYQFYAAEKAYSFDEFSENFEELKYNCPEAVHVLENVLGF